MFWRQAGVGRPVGQDHVTFAPAGLGIGLGAVVADKGLGVGLRQPAGFLAVNRRPKLALTQI